MKISNSVFKFVTLQVFPKVEFLDKNWMFVTVWISFYPSSKLDLGDTLCSIGVKESATAHEAFTKFGEYHRQMEKVGIQMLKKTKRVNFTS